MFDLKPIFREAWGLFKAHTGLLIGASLLVWLVPLIPSSVSSMMFEEDTVSRFVLSFAGVVLGLIVEIGWIGMLIAFVDGRVPPFSDLFSRASLIFRYFVGSVINVAALAAPIVIMIVIGVAVGLGDNAWIPGVFGLVPTVYVAVRLCLWGFFMVDRDTGILESLSLSLKTTRDAWLGLVLFYLAIIAMVVVSLIPLGLGLLVSVPVSGLAGARVYRTLAPDGPDEAT